jgi:hypothetical protein
LRVTGGVISEGSMRGVENPLKTLIDRPNLCLFLCRYCRVNIDVKVRVGDGADGFRGVVIGPFL